MGSPNFNSAQTSVQASTNKDVVIQNPDLIIFRNGQFAYSDNAEILKKMKLPEKPELQHVDPLTPRLTGFTSSGTIQTEPGSASLSFAIPTTETDSNKIKIVEDLDVTNEEMRWHLMDHIEVWTTPNKTNLPYFRTFVGVVTNITFTINAGVCTMALAARDMFYWLGRQKINTRWSVYDIMLRRADLSAKDAENTKAVMYNHRYMGYTFRDILEKTLFDVKSKDAGRLVGRTKEENVTDQDEMEINDIPALGVVSIGDQLALIQGKSVSPLFHFPASKEFSAAMEGKVRAKVGAVLDKVWPGVAIQPNQLSGEYTRDASAVRPALTADGVATGFISSALDVHEARAAQKKNMEWLDMWWTVQWKGFLKANYVPFYRHEDLLLMPFPFSGGVPLRFDGAYATRLEILKQMSDLTLYEVFQSPQGRVIVKPPTYNAPPVNMISAAEINSISRSENLENVLTGATTEGLWVEPTPDKDVPEIPAGQSDTPLVSASYQVLFPVNGGPDGLEGNGTAAFGEGKGNSCTVTISNFGSYVDIRADMEKQKSDLEDRQFSLELREAPFNPPVNITAEEDSYRCSRALLYKFYKQTLRPDVLSTKSVNDDDTGFMTAADRAELFGRAKLFNKNLWEYFRWIEVFLLKHASDFGLTEQQLLNTNAAVAGKIQDLIKAFPYSKTANDTIEVQENRRSAVTSYISSTEQTNSLFATVYLEKDTAQQLSVFTSRGATSDLEKYEKSRIDDIVAEAERLAAERLDDEKHSVSQAVTSVASPAGKVINKAANAIKETSQADEIYALRNRLEQDFRASRPHCAMPGLTLHICGKYKIGDLSKYMTHGKYNVMHHGMKDVKLTNSLIRSTLQAALFSKYWIYRNNAQVEQFTFSLQSYRPDIVPGFTILNTMDGCVYYVQAVSFNFVPGQEATTGLTCICRRRPVFVHESVQETTDPLEYVRTLTFWEKDSGPLSENPKYIASLDALKTGQYSFLGWEMYGPTDNDLGTAFESEDGTFLPPFGGIAAAPMVGTDMYGNKKMPKKAAPGVSGVTIYRLNSPEIGAALFDTASGPTMDITRPSDQVDAESNNLTAYKASETQPSDPGYKYFNWKVLPTHVNAATSGKLLNLEKFIKKYDGNIVFISDIKFKNGGCPQSVKMADGKPVFEIDSATVYSAASVEAYLKRAGFYAKNASLDSTGTLSLGARLGVEAAAKYRSVPSVITRTDTTQYTAAYNKRMDLINSLVGQHRLAVADLKSRGVKCTEI